MNNEFKNKVFYSSNLFQKSQDSSAEDALFIEGYANTVDKDRSGDIIPAYVWEMGLQEYIKNPIILAYHNHDEPIGRMVDYRIDSKGLWIKVRVSAAAENVFNLIKDGILTAFSVGFIIKDASYEPDMDIFVIKQLELLEVSVVSVGMNQNSLFNISKSFSTADELQSFKNNFKKSDTSVKELEKSENLSNKDEEMTPEQISEMLEQASQKAALAAVAAVETARKEKEAADAAALAIAEKKAADIKVTESGTERLLADVEKRLSDSNTSIEKALADMRVELAEKSKELEAMQKSKMNFGSSNSSHLSDQDKEKAVLLATIMNKDVGDTKFGNALVQKYGAHVPSATWELEVSLNMEAEVRRQLVVANTIRSIPMQTNVMTIPVNPEAGNATWITNAQFGTSDSAGAAQTHALKEVTLNAYKVATREYLAYEEEEDALLAILPTIRDGMVRRVARAVDIAFLRGAGSGADPVKGLVPYDASSTVTVSAGSGTVTVANMIALRQDIADWGLDPSQIIYIVSSDVFYDLMEDTTFQTVDKVGDRSTLLTGQMGNIAGSPVLLSGSFDTKANGAAGALVFAPANFLAGNQRGLRFDTQDLVETQRRVLVSSLRTGMVQLTTNLGAGVSVLRYTA